MKFTTKPQAQTLQQRMGFMDADLTTPGHDNIMMYLDDITTSEQLNKWLDAKDLTLIKKEWEMPIMSGTYTIGFVDFVIYYTTAEDEERRIYCEVKTTIPSLGELLRQIGLYREHLTNWKRVVGYDMRDLTHDFVVVVSPDNRFAKKIVEQGFGFIHTIGRSQTQETPTLILPNHLSSINVNSDSNGQAPF